MDNVYDKACELMEIIGAEAFACELARALPTDTLWECIEFIERNHEICA